MKKVRILKRSVNRDAKLVSVRKPLYLSQNPVSLRSLYITLVTTSLIPDPINMIRSLFKLGLLLVGAILVYNYFFGTSSEKENSRKIFGEMRDVVVAVGGLIKDEKAKFDAGKYDKALEQLGGAYRAIRERAEYVDQKVIKRLDELEQRKAQLEQDLNTIEQSDAAPAAPAPKKGIKIDPKTAEQTAAKAADLLRKKEKLQRQLDSLVKDSERLLQEAQKQE